MNLLSVAAVTFFKDDMSLDERANEKLFRDLFNKGVDSIVVGGSTGEGSTLSFEEKLKLVELANTAKFVQSSGNEATSKEVYLNVGTNDTMETLKLVERVNNLSYENRPGGIMVVCPYYNKPSQEGLYEHFKHINRATKLPLMVYHIPGRTGVTMELSTMKRISELKNVKYIKESSKDPRLVSWMVSHISNKKLDVEMLSGDDKMTIPYMSLGATGVVSVIGNLYPEKMKSMMDEFEDEGVEAAKELQNEIMRYSQKIFPDFAPNPVAAKYLMSKEGMGEELVRLPLVGLNSTEKKTVDMIQ